MTDLARWLAAVYARDLSTLRLEIEAYPSDAELWKLVPGISNSGGNLALHLSGNLQHFIGAVLGKSGYVRNRDAEFASRDKSRADLVRDVDAALAVVPRTVQGLDAGTLSGQYPLAVANMRLTTGDFLLHLATHFAYHLGQLDYHRRVVTGGAALGSALSPTRLATAAPEPTA